MAMHPARAAYVEEADDEEKTFDLSNVPVDTDYYLPATQTGGPSAKASAVLAEFSRKRQAAAIAVPTDDGHVRTRLRKLDEPMTLFGERPEDRRDRLRGLLHALQEGADGDEVMADAAEEAEADDSNQEFYTAGTIELAEARKAIAQFSLPRAQRRIQYQRLESGIPLNRHVEHRNTVRDRLAGFELFGSQIAGDRPVGMVRFAPDGQTVAAGNWGGSIRLLGVPDLEEKMLLRGHTSQVSGISWFPGATSPGSAAASENTISLASGGGEGNVNLWSFNQDTPLATLQGHSGRVCRVEFHPSGRYLASASYDTTWRLWDVETTTELVLQEGHSREAFAVAFNTDGSLLASAGLDSVACLWDVRTGRRILYFESHISPIYALDWSVDGYRIMTGSGDGFAKCWDIRMMRETASIGAHKGGVTDLRWYKGMDGPVNYDSNAMSDGLEPKKAGTFFVSSGFDRNVNIFSSDDWALCKSLSGHSGNVLSTDVTNDARWIVSSSFDRTVKLWARDDMEAL
ncbi:U4/U6 small nuclear ribonucleoprotein [Myriangium duriaei CBS 260.36]|uniref:U4/U6 small nuclear ribonucleoprotein n=1 Tax=Myriangium duriaei CBS 260.36 TaxID=1168546 RepID=A0A9P4J2N7_9PEZI|nr:U4/U6 small nuclear ribonucleoprotein [Myriangium duriaei CBS 260.36]